MRLLRSPLGLVGQYFRPFLLMNLVYFGLVGAGVAYGGWQAGAHDSVRGAIDRELPQTLPGVVNAYKGGHFAQAVAWTFVINLCLGTLLYISLPSLVVPFSGILLGTVRAIVWGIVFSPRFAAISAAGLTYALLVGLLIMLEGEGYVLGMLGSYVHGKALVAPASAGTTTRWEGYKTGVMRMLRIYPLIATVLAVAAIYEATLVIFILPALS